MGRNEEHVHEDILALEEYEAAAEGDMSQANRTWAEARQLILSGRASWGKMSLWESKRDMTWKTHSTTLHHFQESMNLLNTWKQQRSKHKPSSPTAVEPSVVSFAVRRTRRWTA